MEGTLSNTRGLITIREDTKDLIKQANAHRQDKKDCCLCNKKSNKEHLCKDCLKRGWVLK